MHAEYLIFNMVVFLMPFIFSFEKNMNFYQHFKSVVASIVLIAIPYIIWDALVTNFHWWFNDTFHFNVTFLKLPIEEILFFFTIPFAGLFIWEVLRFYSRQTDLLQHRFFKYNFTPIKKKKDTINKILILLSLLLVIILYFSGKEYAALVSFSGFLLLIADRTLTHFLLLSRQFLLFSLILFVLILIFNGYLTARPVVLYNNDILLGIRIFTIPLEDFFYGLSLLGWNIVLYENFRKRKMHALA